MSDKIENISIVKKSNVYFDGKCVSHTVLFPDGMRKTLGVIMPDSKLTFNVGAPEVMEITSGSCDVKIAGEPAFKTYTAGMQFSVAENSIFEIHTKDTVDYVCSFG